MPTAAVVIGVAVAVVALVSIVVVKTVRQAPGRDERSSFPVWG
jgi:hypothetical protein